MPPTSRKSDVDRTVDRPVIDGHCDTVLKSIERTDGLQTKRQDGHVDAPRARTGTVSALFFACWVHPEKDENGYAASTYRLLDELHRLCKEDESPFRIALTGKEVRKQHRANHISIIPCVEGGHAIENSLRHLRNFYRLGARYMTLTWMNNNEWADASGDDPEHNGLTDRGVRVVQEMNRLGMIVDLSHTARSTFADAVRASDDPVIASHSCCRSICDHHRNLTDEQLCMISDVNGVAGICFYPGFLDSSYRRALDRYEDETDEDDWMGKLPEERRPEVGLEQLFTHIEHAVDVAGVDHVGLGSDFDGIVALPDGMDDCSDYTLISKGLLDRGFSEQEVNQVMGGNFLRVIDEVCGSTKSV